MIWPTVAGDQLVLSSFHQVRILHRFRSLALGRAVPVLRKLVEFIPSSGLLPPKFPSSSERAPRAHSGGDLPEFTGTGDMFVPHLAPSVVLEGPPFSALACASSPRVDSDTNLGRPPILALAYQSSRIEGFKPPFNVHSSCLSPNDSSHCSPCI
jgi:hypothetical protein